MKYLLVFLGLLYSSLADDAQVLKEFSTGYNSFASDVYKELLKVNSGNFIVCPLSADIVLALVDAGAQGKTSKELTSALRLPENHEKVNQIFKALSPNLQSGDKYNLSSANKIYTNEGFQISEEFKSVAVNVFGAEIQNIDFKKNEKAAAEINKWVEDKTHDKIKDLISPDMLDEDTRSVLVNAIYFHGKWVKEFDTRSTYKLPFHVNSKDKSDTDMMTLTDQYEYYECSESNAKFLKLDYEGGDVSMHIVLPNDVEGLAVLEEKIENLLVPPKYTNEKVYVRLPKFTIDTKIKFKPILKAIGVKNAFEDYADFTGIGANQESLKISEVIQKAFIEVEEKGTTAAAATGVVMIQTQSLVVEYPPPKEFHADHPFLFYLRLNKPGVNFFIGRYKGPEN